MNGLLNLVGSGYIMQQPNAVSQGHWYWPADQEDLKEHHSSLQNLNSISDGHWYYPTDEEDKAEHDRQLAEESRTN